MRSRKELEEHWRRWLEESQNKYVAATQEYRRLLQQELARETPSPDSSLAHAGQAKADALTEYSHVLRIFTDLTIDNQVLDDKGIDIRTAGADCGNETAIVGDDESRL